MLSLIKGIPIARAGENVIYLNAGSVSDRLSKDFKTKLSKLTRSEKKNVIESIECRSPPEGNKLFKLYEAGIKDLNAGKSVNSIKTKKKIQVLPRKDLVEKLYISGVSGSGKSTYTGGYIKEFKKMFPNDEIFVFSSVSKDAAFDKYNPVRIPIDMELIEDPLNIHDFENSLTIFDDTDTIKNKQYRDSVNDIKAEMIEIGRHNKARCIITSHIISNYKSTRQILNEATSVSFFPKAGGVYHIKNFLKTHVGLDKNQIERVLNLPSRWVTIYRTYPSYIVWENGIVIMSEF